MARTDKFNSLTKEEQLEVMRNFTGCGSTRSSFSMEERYPDMADDEEIVKQEVPPSEEPATTIEDVAEKDETESNSTIQPAPVQELQSRPVSLPDGKQSPVHRISSKQRRLSLDEYASVFLPVPKIDHPKPVFISETLRDEIDKVARRLGGKRMSASGIVENMVRHHLGIYGEDIGQWFKLCALRQESAVRLTWLDTEGGTIAEKRSFECGEVMFSASRKRPRPHSRCGGNPLPDGRRFCQFSH